MLTRLFQKKSIKRAARTLYDQLSLASRVPEHYGPERVPDTPDGRFEMLALHSAVLFARLAKRGEQAEEISQEVFNIMFSGFDHALRNLGVGDLGVGKRIRKLAESFYGRIAVYHTALQEPDPQRQHELMRAAISRHVLSLEGDECAFAEVLSQRAQDWTMQLAQIPDDKILAGELPLPV